MAHASIESGTSRRPEDHSRKASRGYMQVRLKAEQSEQGEPKV